MIKIALDMTPTIIRHLDGRIVTWTEGAEELYGWTEQEALGRFAHQLLRTEFPDSLYAVNRKVLKERKWVGELTHYSKAGKRIFVESRWRAHWDEASGIEHVIEVSHDITGWKMAELELKRANTELTSFAFEVAHDIQGPLRNISTFVALLGRSLTNTLAEGEFLDQIVHAVYNLSQLVASLLQYATSEIHEIPIGEVDLNEAVAHVRDHLKLIIAESGAVIEADELPKVCANRLRMFRVMKNLVQNAIKYKRPGVSPRLTITAQPCGEQQVIHVRDNGCGISPEYTKMIFAPLKRLHGRDIPGSGLGLAICKRFIEAEGGQIWVDSRVGEGSTFHFSVPSLDSGIKCVEQSQKC